MVRTRSSVSSKKTAIDQSEEKSRLKNKKSKDLSENRSKNKKQNQLTGKVLIQIKNRSSNRNEWKKRWHYSLLLANSFCPFLRLLIVNYAEAHIHWMVCSDSRCGETCLPGCLFLHTPYLIVAITNWRRKWRLTSSLAYSQSVSPLPWRAKTAVQLCDKQLRP